MHGRAQNVMAVDDHLQRFGEGVNVCAAVKGKLRLQHIGVAPFGADVVVENAFLQRRQRIDVLHVRCATGHAGHHLVDLLLIQVDQRQHVRSDSPAVRRNAVGRNDQLVDRACRRSQCREGRLAEQRTHVGAQAGLAHTFNQTHCQQRMTAQFKEVVVATDTLDLEQVAPDLRQSDFGCALWLLVAATDQCITVRCWQGLAVEFTVRGQRHCVEQHIGRRDHVGRQLFLQPAAQAIDVHRSLPCAQGVISRQTLVAGNVFSGSHYGFVDRRVFGQACIDLAQFDTEAADFHLIVVTAQVFDIAVWQIPAKVAGAVHACRRLLAERVLEEAFGSQVVTVQVTARHTGPADVDLAHNAQWNGLLLFIQQVELRIAHWFADVRSEAVFAIHRHPA
ncbi:Uncharacterized protein AC517_0552 [Pseudomonas syringae pv. syringae]|nr:Uncharacterized protein AC517_0552 [Pseudomonas syringae pv. syringae]